MEDFEIQKLANQDVNNFIAVIRLFEDVFEMKDFTMPQTEHLQNLLDKDTFFVFAAMSENKIVGGLTAYVLQQYYATLPVVYIYDLAVARELQRRGIGKLLISAITSYCKEKGVQEVFVQADLADDYALDFYRSTGATSEEVIHFTYALNEATR